MIRLSIIIPCLETDGRLDDSLASVLQNRPDQCEVLVVHRGPYDDPYDLAGEVTFLEAPAQEELVALLNRGLSQAQGPVVHLLGCGCEATDGWTNRPLARFEDSRVAAVSPLLLDARRDDGFVCTGVTSGMLGRRQTVLTPNAQDAARNARQRPLGPSLRAAFFRVEALRAIGGFDGAIDASLADLDVALSLNKAGYRCVVEPAAHVLGSEQSLARQDARRAGQSAERVFWRHLSAQGGVGAVLLHPFALAADFALQLPRGGAVGRLLGRLSVLKEASQHVRHAASLPQKKSSLHSPRGATRRIDAAHHQEQRTRSGAETFVP